LFDGPLRATVTRRNTDPNKKIKLDKVVKNTCDFLTYGLMAVVGLYGVHGHHGIPKALGGAGSCPTLCLEWPRPKFHYGLRIYSIVQHGYHFKSNHLHLGHSNFY